MIGEPRARHVDFSGTVARSTWGTIAMTSAPALGLNWPEGQPDFMGPTPNSGLGYTLELSFFFLPPAFGWAVRWSCSYMYMPASI
ncbi:unnamed protein product [Prunus armeniaca]